MDNQSYVPLIVDEDVRKITEEYLKTNHEETRDLQLSLLQMGFETNMIDMMFCFNTVHSIEEAVNLLTKNENGVWQHNRVTGGKDNKKCIICQEDEPHVNDLELSRSSNLSSMDRESLMTSIRKSRDRNEENEENEEDNLCEVCYVNDKSDIDLSITCGHKFCIDCWKDYIKNKINVNEVLDIPCMSKGCSETLNNDDVLKIIGNRFDPLYRKFLLFVERKNKQLQNKDKKTKQCPHRDCEGYLEYDKDNKYVTCEFGHQYCYNCLQPWHGNKSCNEIIDQEFMKWKKGKIVKQCPQCGYYTEKNRGCNHMTCAKCKFQWCWLCSGQYSATHYTEGPCRGLQFATSRCLQRESCLRCYQRTHGFFKYYFLFLASILGFCVIGGPASAGAFTYIVGAEDIAYSSCVQCIMTIPSIIVGLCFQPIFTCIGVVAFSLVLVSSILFPPLVKIINEKIEDM